MLNYPSHAEPGGTSASHLRSLSGSLKALAVSVGVRLTPVAALDGEVLVGALGARSSVVKLVADE